MAAAVAAAAAVVPAAAAAVVVAVVAAAGAAAGAQDLVETIRGRRRDRESDGNASFARLIYAMDQGNASL